MKVSFKMMLGLVTASFVFGVGVSGYLSQNTPSLPVTENVSFSGIQTAFCPSPECTTLPISAVDGAKNYIYVAMYSFTNEDFSQALIRAKERGVDVRVIVEKQQAGSQYSQHDELSLQNIPVRIDTNPSLMHHKFAVIDEGLVITGSMNWTGNGVGENNENVIIVHSNELNTLFVSEFEKVWGESIAFEK